jgi:DNA-binding transcriptional LysR family regulator
VEHVQGGSVIETRHLKIFVSVYRTRSFTKAAEELYTSQPTVSEHIQNLEARLNCRLFDRLGRSILPTAEAEALYPRAIAILEDLRRLEEEISLTRSSVSGELLIGASTIPGSYILPVIATAFKQRFPEISFEIRIQDSARIVSEVAGNDLHLGVVGAKIAAPNLKYQPLIDDQLILIAAGSHPAPMSVTIDELCRLPFIVRERGSGTRKSTEALLAKQQRNLDQLNICATMGSGAAVKEAVKGNLGVSVISRLAVQNELDCGTLREIAISGVTMQQSFYVVTSQKRTLPKHYDEFLKHLLKLVLRPVAPKSLSDSLDEK